MISAPRRSNSLPMATPIYVSRGEAERAAQHPCVLAARAHLALAGQGGITSLVVLDSDLPDRPLPLVVGLEKE